MIIGMECGCTSSCDFDNEPEAFTASYPRARVVHVCCECKEAILPGNKYELTWGIWVGSMYTFKTCKICTQIRNDYGCCASYGNLRREIWESLGVDYITGKIREEGE